MEELHYRKWLNEQNGHRAVVNLKKNGFQAHFTTSAEEAVDLAVKLVEKLLAPSASVALPQPGGLACPGCWSDREKQYTIIGTRHPGPPTLTFD
jgi:hypothetical protein